MFSTCFYLDDLPQRFPLSLLTSLWFEIFASCNTCYPYSHHKVQVAFYDLSCTLFSFTDVYRRVLVLSRDYEIVELEVAVHGTQVKTSLW
jgi:hypothetical protein